MSLRFALLALLSIDATTGYDLQKRFDSSVGHVTAQEVPWGAKGAKREYSITEASRDALRDWMNATLPYTRFRDAMRLKSAYFEWANPDAARAQMRARLAHAEPAPRRDTREGSRPHGRVHALRLRRLVGRAEQEIAWARDGLTLIDELEEKD